MTRIRITQRFTRGRFASKPALWRAFVAGLGSSHVLEILPAFSYISWACAFCAGYDASIFFSGPAETEGVTSDLSRRAGSSEIPWRILSLVKENLHRHRAGFEPRHAASLMKRLKAPPY
jgi:hypothetical protein